MKTVLETMWMVLGLITSVLEWIKNWLSIGIGISILGLIVSILTLLPNILSQGVKLRLEYQEPYRVLKFPEIAVSIPAGGRNLIELKTRRSDERSFSKYIESKAQHLDMIDNFVINQLGHWSLQKNNEINFVRL